MAWLEIVLKLPEASNLAAHGFPVWICHLGVSKVMWNPANSFLIWMKLAWQPFTVITSQYRKKSECWNDIDFEVPSGSALLLLFRHTAHTVAILKSCPAELHDSTRTSTWQALPLWFKYILILTYWHDMQQNMLHYSLYIPVPTIHITFAVHLQDFTTLHAISKGLGCCRRIPPTPWSNHKSPPHLCPHVLSIDLLRNKRHWWLLWWGYSAI